MKQRVLRPWIATNIFKKYFEPLKKLHSVEKSLKKSHFTTCFKWNIFDDFFNTLWNGGGRWPIIRITYWPFSTHFFKSLIENYCAFHIKESRNSKASNQSEIFWCQSTIMFRREELAEVSIFLTSQISSVQIEDFKDDDLDFHQFLVSVTQFCSRNAFISASRL